MENKEVIEVEIKVTDEEIERLTKEELADLIMLRLDKAVAEKLKEK